MDMEDEECSLRAFLSTSRTRGEPLRLGPRDELPELWADLTRVQESKETSGVLLVGFGGKWRKAERTSLDLAHSGRRGCLLQ